MPTSVVGLQCPVLVGRPAEELLPDHIWLRSRSRGGQALDPGDGWGAYKVARTHPCLDCGRPCGTRGLRCKNCANRLKVPAMIAARGHQMYGPATVCMEPTCLRPVVARGWCDLHWRRGRAHGDPGWEVPSAEQRFWSKVQPVGSGCWERRADLDQRGYGWFRFDGRQGRRVAAHRWAYEQLIGPLAGRNYTTAAVIPVA